LKNRKASVPIGTIVIIIIVLIAGLGIWWWFTSGQCAAYSDITRENTETHILYQHKDYSQSNINFVEIEYNRAMDTWGLNWRTSPTSLYGMAGLSFDEMPGVIDGYLNDKQKDLGHQIRNAIEKGCV